VRAENVTNTGTQTNVATTCVMTRSTSAIDQRHPLGGLWVRTDPWSSWAAARPDEETHACLHRRPGTQIRVLRLRSSQRRPGLLLRLPGSSPATDSRRGFASSCFLLCETAEVRHGAGPLSTYIAMCSASRANFPDAGRRLCTHQTCCSSQRMAAHQAESRQRAAT
jgi:hypothetical protein